VAYFFTFLCITPRMSSDEFNRTYLCLLGQTPWVRVTVCVVHAAKPHPVSEQPTCGWRSHIVSGSRRWPHLLVLFHSCTRMRVSL